MHRLILGSQSPRRSEILHFFSLPFEQHSSDFSEELIPFRGDPAEYAQTLSRAKAASLADRFPDVVILTADTCVYKQGQLFNKLRDDEHAFEILKELNGSWHSVFTGVTVRLGLREISACEETKVLFHRVDEEKLMLYHKACQGSDKAGGYGIQDKGSIIIKRIEGCFYNVMGLPISTVCQLLQEMEIDLWHYLE